MVKDVTSLTQSGLRSWLIQNFTAFFMAVYLITLVIYSIFSGAYLDFNQWHDLFSSVFVKIATLLFFFFLILHTRIGLWMIATDYLKNTAVRLVFIILISLILISSFLWAVSILWGV